MINTKSKRGLLGYGTFMVNASQTSDKSSYAL